MRVDVVMCPQKEGNQARSRATCVFYCLAGHVEGGVALTSLTEVARVFDVGNDELCTRR